MIYELRIYRCLPGKVQALSKRFETITVKLFQKHGFRQIGYWTVTIGENNHDFIYMLGWESHAERDRCFAAFQADPEWIAARAKSEEGGPLLSSISNTILAATSYSELK